MGPMELGQICQGGARSSAEQEESRSARGQSVQWNEREIFRHLQQYKQEGETREGASACSSMSSLGAHWGGMWASTGVGIRFSPLRKLSEGSGRFLHLIGGTSGESAGHKMTDFQVRVEKSVFMASSLPQWGGLDGRTHKVNWMLLYNWHSTSVCGIHTRTSKLPSECCVEEEMCSWSEQRCWVNSRVLVIWPISWLHYQWCMCSLMFMKHPTPPWAPATPV